MKTVNRSTSLGRLGLVFAVFAVLYCLWHVFLRKSLDRDAVQLAEAMRIGDASALFNATLNEERCFSNLTKRTVQSAWNILVKPHLEGSTYVRSEKGAMDRNGVQATAAVWFRDNSGKMWRLLLLANQSDDGARISLMVSMLLFSCLFDEKNQFVDSVSSERQLATLKKHREALENLGIHRLMRNPQSCVTWDQYHSLLEANIRNKEELKKSEVKMKV